MIKRSDRVFLTCCSRRFNRPRLNWREFSLRAVDSPGLCFARPSSLLRKEGKKIVQSLASSRVTIIIRPPAALCQQNTNYCGQRPCNSPHPAGAERVRKMVQAWTLELAEILNSILRRQMSKFSQKRFDVFQRSAKRILYFLLFKGE